MCLYCGESLDESTTYVVMQGSYAHVICWITVYRCQLQDVLQYIREREGELMKGGRHV